MACCIAITAVGVSASTISPVSAVEVKLMSVPA